MKWLMMILVLSLTACQVNDFFENEYENWHTLKGQSFTVKYPADWIVKVTVFDTLTKDKFYQLLPSHLKSTGVGYIAGFIEYAPEGSFQSESHAVLESLSRSFGQDISVYNNVDFTFKGFEANKKELTLPNADRKIPFDVYLINGMKKFYIVMYNRGGYEPKEIDPLFDKILNSLTIAKN